MRVVVVGAGIGGLGSALALSRAGHEVTVLERDATPLPASADAAFQWDRRGAPQVRHSHALLARLRNLLRDRFPDVLADLHHAGVTEIHFAEMLPETITDRSPQPGDEDLVALAGRRTTFEWVLRRAVLAAERVDLIDGVAVQGLCFSPATTDGDSASPLVTGVRVARAGGSDIETVDADLVVVANGPRSNLPAWLAEGGVTLPETVEDTGIVYYSRFFNLVDGAEPPRLTGPVGGDLGYLKYGVFQGDNRTFSITLACQADDKDMRALLIDPLTFNRTAATLPSTAPWLAPGMAEAVTEVQVMAKLLNRRRRFLDDRGRPRVLAAHAVGDAHTCTNPMYGRGCSLAMVQATLLADALAAEPVDAVERSVAYERACEREITPWYEAAVAQDRMNRTENAAPLVSEAVSTATQLPADLFRDVLRHGLFPALRVDPVVFRAFLRMFNLLTPPDALMTDGDVVTRVMAVYQDRGNRPPEPDLGPERADLLERVSLQPPPG